MDIITYVIIGPDWSKQIPFLCMNVITYTGLDWIVLLGHIYLTHWIMYQW